MKLFGTDGIRGIYGNYPLDAPTIRKIGHALALTLSNNIKNIIISHDGRESFMNIYQNLLDGILLEKKFNIIYLGLFPTPSLPYILSENVKKDSIGIQITASHNPYTDNGIKIFNHNGFKISPLDEMKIQNLVINQKTFQNESNLVLTINQTTVSLYENYILKLLNSDNNISHKLNIAIDCANGALSELISRLDTPKNISFKIFNNNPNGTNINDKCGAVSPQYLAEEIIKINNKDSNNFIDFGITFDGDGDRAILITSSGRILDGDEILYLLSINTNNNKILVGTVMTNFGIRNNLNKLGYTFIETSVGDKNVLDAMLSNNADLGSESSGHVIHRNLSKIPIGDAVITMFKIIQLIQKRQKNLDQIYPDTLKVPSVLINIDSSDPNTLIDDNYLLFKKIKEILGEDGRIFVRKSGTQSLVRILIEHESGEILRKTEELIKGKL